MSERSGVEGSAYLDAWLEAALRRLATHEPVYRPPGACPGGEVGTSELRSPEREVRFVFESATDDSGLAWRAELVVPPNSTAGTALQIVVRDGFGHPVEHGVLRLSGCAVPIEYGKGTILFEMFVGGVRNTCVSLDRDGHVSVPGALTFFGGSKG